MRSNIFSKRHLLIIFIGFWISTFPICESVETTTEEDDGRMLYRNTYEKIIGDLRDHWQSPIMYLKKRGYLPDLKDIMTAKQKRYHSKTDYTDDDGYDVRKQDRSAFDVKQLDEQLYKDVINKPEDLNDYNDVERSANHGFFSNMKDKLANLFAVKKTEDNLEKDDVSRKEDDTEEANFKDEEEGNKEKDRVDNEVTKSELKTKDEVKNFIKDDLLPLDGTDDTFSGNIDISDPDTIATFGLNA